jgi:hypothetical protein
MSLWISSTGETDRRFSPPHRGSTVPPPEEGRSWCTYLVAGLIGLSIGLILGQIAAEHRTSHSRIQWPEPTLPHPRSLPP